MNKKTIGIPRAFLYYRYKILWKNYFSNLGYKIVVSGPTTKETVVEGKKYSIDEACLPFKIFMGHVSNLREKCDYILIPRIENYGKDEKVCVRFNATYDIVKNIFKDINIINYNIEYTKMSTETISLLKLGLKLNHNPFIVISSYIKAKKAEKEYNKLKMINQSKVLTKRGPKVLIVSHPYSIYDNYLGYSIIKLLKNYKINILYADKLSKKESLKHYKKLSKTLYWTYSKELIGAIDYYKDNIDGIIFLTAFPCGPDSLVNELMIRKLKKMPTLNIILDELRSETGLETRVESFIDILRERRDNNS